MGIGNRPDAAGCGGNGESALFPGRGKGACSWWLGASAARRGQDGGRGHGKGWGGRDSSPGLLGGKERSARRQERELQRSGGGRDPVQLEGGMKQNRGYQEVVGWVPCPKERAWRYADTSWANMGAQWRVASCSKAGRISTKCTTLWINTLGWRCVI